MTTTTLETREFQVRLADAEKREFTGIAVPYDTVADIGWYREKIAPGAVEGGDEARIFWRHDEPIGLVTAHEDTEDGWLITGRISATARGDEAYTLLRDGVVDRLSIGFEPIEHTETTEEDGSITITRTRIKVREVSIVPQPAYEGAQVTEVREAERKETDMTVTTVTPEDLAEVRESVETLNRRIDVGLTPAPTEHRDLFPSVGELIKAIASGDETAIRAYNEAFETRAYDGATSASTILKDGWIGNFIEIIKRRRPILSTFATGSLPAQGLGVEYAVLKADSTQVGVQATEGADLAFGKVSIETKNAPVVTLGGWTSLSRQAIERANVGILNTSWEALAEKYGQASEAYARGVLTAALAATGAAALAEVEADLTTQDGIVAAVLDLAEHFENAGRALDGVLVDKATFLALYSVEASDRVLQVTGAPSDKVGTITVRSAQGDVAGLPFKLLPNATAGTVLAYDATAIKTLEAGGAPFRLQDGNVVNLTQDFSLYGYLASFVQKPAGLVKVVEEG